MWFAMQNIVMLLRIIISHNTNFEYYLECLRQDGKLPNHIIYWIKLEIKKCRKAIAKERKKA